jgi:hypothetical protein
MRSSFDFLGKWCLRLPSLELQPTSYAREQRHFHNLLLGRLRRPAGTFARDGVDGELVAVPESAQTKLITAITTEPIGQTCSFYGHEESR